MSAQPYPPAGYAPAARPRRVGLVGVLITTIGCLMLLLSMAIVWYSTGRLDHVNLRDIVEVADATGAKALPHAFFGWLLWLLWAMTVVLALLANLPNAFSGALRVLSPLLGCLGALLVYLSLDALTTGSGSVFDHAVIGVWLA